ncbi:MAG: serine protease [Chitinophagales bacterium]|nr:serine protease [Chitinophagales bacterium]
MNKANKIDLQDALVRILDEEGETIGSGLLIDKERGLIVTCSHVIIDREEQEKSEIKLPEQVYFTFFKEELVNTDYAAEKVIRVASILENWLPFSQGDVIILKYSEEIPDIVKSYPIGKSNNLFHEEKYVSHGFPERGFLTSLPSKGKIFPNKIKTKFGFEVILISDESENIIGGFSGAPVLNQTTGNIIGIISWIFPPDSKTSKLKKNVVIIPSELILKVIPEPYELRPAAPTLLQEPRINPDLKTSSQKADFIYYNDSLVSEQGACYIEFRIFSLFDIRPELLLGRTAWDNFFPEFYFSRPKIDDELRELAEKNKTIVLTGQSLTGKSRTLYHFLKSIDTNSQIVIADVKQFGRNSSHTQNSVRNISQLSLSEILNPNQEKMYFIFNDLDKFLSVHEVDQLFEQIVYSRHSMLATCREDEYEMVTEELIDLVISSKWKTIYVPRLTTEETIPFRAELNKYTNLNPNEDDIDATIGSYFLNLDEMRKYFLQFEREKSIELHILWALKIETVIRNASRGKSD